jgi:hypothetical protein
MKIYYYSFNYNEEATINEINVGRSRWYFETDSKCYVLRQVVVYEYLHRLKYNSENIEDEWGGLGEGSLETMMPDLTAISKQEFQQEYEK